MSTVGRAGEFRNPIRERQERRRYELLRAIQDLTGEDFCTPILGTSAGDQIGMEREETFRHVQFLSHKGYLRYMGAGPLICLSPRGQRYLRSEARRRRSVR